MTTIQIDPEFKALIPPLSPEEYAQLEANILADGCRDAVVVWKGENILVDGHNRFEICSKHGIAFNVREIEFDCKEAAILWMLENQLGRRNLLDAIRIEMALQIEPIERELARLRQLASLKQNQANTVPPISAERTKGETREKLAAKARVGRTKLSQGDYILKQAPSYIREQWRAGDLTANHAYELAKLLEKAHKRTVALMLKAENVDREIVPILDRLAKNKSDTLEEIELTGFIQWGDAAEAIPFGKVSALQLQKYLDFKAKEHKEQAKELRRAESAERGKDATVEAIQFIRADFRDVLSQYEPNSIDIIFTDPPYHESYLYLWRALGELSARVLKPGGLLIAYSGQNFLDRVLVSVGECLTFHWMMAAKNRRGDLRIWHKNIWNSWKPIVVWSKGENIHPWMPDFYSGATQETKLLHDWAQPIEEAELLLKYLTDGQQTILDPMCGSGSIPIAAARLGLKSIGIEVDERTFYMAKDRAAQYLEGVNHDAPAAA